VRAREILRLRRNIEADPAHRAFIVSQRVADHSFDAFVDAVPAASAGPGFAARPRQGADRGSLGEPVAPVE